MRMTAVYEPPEDKAGGDKRKGGDQAGGTAKKR